MATSPSTIVCSVFVPPPRWKEDSSTSVEVSFGEYGVAKAGDVLRPVAVPQATVVLADGASPTVGNATARVIGSGMGLVRGDVIDVRVNNVSVSWFERRSEFELAFLTPSGSGLANEVTFVTRGGLVSTAAMLRYDAPADVHVVDAPVVLLAGEFNRTVVLCGHNLGNTTLGTVSVSVLGAACPQDGLRMLGADVSQQDGAT